MEATGALSGECKSRFEQVEAMFAIPEKEPARAREAAREKDPTVTKAEGPKEESKQETSHA